MTEACGMRNAAGTRPLSSSGASGCGWRPPGGSPAATRSARSRDLRVTEGSVRRWHRAWRDGGTAALRSKGPVSRERLSPQQWARLELELRKGPLASVSPTGHRRCRRARCRAPPSRSRRVLPGLHQPARGRQPPGARRAHRRPGRPCCCHPRPGRRRQHQRERLAAAVSQPLARIARLYWDDPGDYLRDAVRFRQMLRPACRRCTARLASPGPSPAACRRT
jgi:hypothetical protein